MISKATGLKDIFISTPADVAYVPRLWAEARGRVLTTFHLETTVNPDGTDGRGEVDALKALHHLPFSCFGIAENMRIPRTAFAPEAAARLIVRKDGYVYLRNYTCFELIATNDQKFNFIMLMKTVYDDGGVSYAPNPAVSSQADVRAGETIGPYLRFYTRLRDRKLRFVDVPLSRQMRRSQGLPREYREFIIISRSDVRYSTASSRTEVMRRMRALHAVRGHQRTAHMRDLGNGRTAIVPAAFIRPHARGVGSALQVRDYQIERPID